MIPAKDWIKDLVIYQVYPRSFYDSNGDGVGDLPGVLAKLDHLVDLGINAVWLPRCTAPPTTTTATTSPTTRRSWRSSAPWRIGSGCGTPATATGSFGDGNHVL